MSNAIHIEPLVSVIVPGYNHGGYLRRRVDSILHQTYQNLEIILMDDCSQDDSAAILKSYAEEPRVAQLLLNERNSGNTFRQWEKGILAARGEYIWIAESDDMADPQFVEKLMRPILSYGAVVAFSYSRLIDPDDKPLPKNPNRPWLYQAPGIYEGLDFALRRLALANLIFNASMVIWKKQCFCRVSPQFKDYRHCGDWLFWFDLCRQGKVAEVPEYLNFFRQHPQKVTVKAGLSGDNFREIAPIERHILDEIKASPYQRRVVRGRCARRLRGADSTVRLELQQLYPDIYRANSLDRLCYALDKLMNLSGLQYSTWIKS